MLHNRVKKKVEQGEVSYGISLAYNFPHPDIIEFAGRLGFEYVFIDAEHSPISWRECTELVRACDVVGMASFVRVPGNNPNTILGYLETGTTGIMAPHVNTAADAQALVDAVRYSPIGHRGAGQMRGADFGVTMSGAEYFAKANEETWAAALVEDIEGFRNLDEILAVEGLDIVVPGPGDLAMSLGRPGQSTAPDIVEMVHEATARIVKAGKVVQANVPNAAAGREAVARGVRMVALDIKAVLRDGGLKFLADMRA